MKTVPEIKASLPDDLIYINNLTLGVFKLNQEQEQLYWQSILTAFSSGRAHEATEQLRKATRP